MGPRKKKKQGKSAKTTEMLMKIQYIKICEMQRKQGLDTYLPFNTNI